MSLKCNCCWEDLGQEAFLTLSCSHIFCSEDAKKYFNKDLVCPICDTALSKSALVHLNLNASAEKLVLLCGLNPKKILEISAKAIEFWDYQKQTEVQFLDQQLKTMKAKCNQIEKHYNEKLIENQNKINVLSHKAKTLEEERETEKKEYQDLQEKFAEKCRQKRKLAELYENLKASRGSTPGSGGGISAAEGLRGLSPLRSPQPMSPMTSQPGHALRSFPSHVGQTSVPKGIMSLPTITGPRKPMFSPLRKSPNKSSRTFDRFDLLRRASPSGISKQPRPVIAFSTPLFKPIQRPVTPSFSSEFTRPG